MLAAFTADLAHVLAILADRFASLLTSHLVLLGVAVIAGVLLVSHGFLSFVLGKGAGFLRSAMSLIVRPDVFTGVPFSTSTPRRFHSNSFRIRLYSSAQLSARSKSWLSTGYSANCQFV